MRKKTTPSWDAELAVHVHGAANRNALLDLVDPHKLRSPLPAAFVLGYFGPDLGQPSPHRSSKSRSLYVALVPVGLVDVLPTPQTSPVMDSGTATEEKAWMDSPGLNHLHVVEAVSLFLDS